MKSVAILLVGAWLTGSILMAVVATQNFATVDRMLTQPTPQAAAPLVSLPHDSMRMLLRHLSSELNRLYFVVWGFAQIILGVGVMLLLLLASRRVDACIAAVMLVIANLQLVLLTPRITDLGRALDFVPRNPVPPSAAAQLTEFWRLHTLFSGSDLLLMALGLVLAWRLCLSKP